MDLFKRLVLYFLVCILVGYTLKDQKFDPATDLIPAQSPFVK